MFHQKTGPYLRKCIAASLKILFWSLVLLMVIQCSAGMTISYILSDFMVTDAGTPVASGGIRWPLMSGWNLATFAVTTILPKNAVNA